MPCHWQPKNALDHAAGTAGPPVLASRGPSTPSPPPITELTPQTVPSHFRPASPGSSYALPSCAHYSQASIPHPHQSIPGRRCPRRSSRQVLRRRPPRTIRCPRETLSGPPSCGPKKKKLNHGVRLDTRSSHHVPQGLSRVTCFVIALVPISLCTASTTLSRGMGRDE